MPAKLRQHRPIDNSVTNLDVESIPYGCSGFESEVRDRMESRPVAELSRLYPELIFVFHPGSKPAGHDIVAKCRGGWVAASWRKAEAA